MTSQLALLNQLKSADKKRRRRPSSTRSTVKSTSFCGSVAYASPEVVSGEHYDPKISDMWSCGVILYILMMGKMPFDDSHPKKMLRRQRAKKYLEKIQPVLQESAVELIEGMLDPRPSTRMTVDEALTHPYVRNMYRTKLKQLMEEQKAGRNPGNSQPRPASARSNNTGSNDSMHDTHTHASSDSLRSATSTVSVNSITSGMDMKARHRK